MDRLYVYRYRKPAALDMNKELLSSLVHWPCTICIFNILGQSTDPIKPTMIIESIRFEVIKSIDCPAVWSQFSSGPYTAQYALYGTLLKIRKKKQGRTKGFCQLGPRPIVEASLSGQVKFPGSFGIHFFSSPWRGRHQTNPLLRPYFFFQDKSIFSRQLRGLSFKITQFLHRDNAGNAHYLIWDNYHDIRNVRTLIFRDTKKCLFTGPLVVEFMIFFFYD